MIELEKRKNHKLRNFDYGGGYGYYFVTICTKDYKCLLSDIVGNDALVVPQLTQLGCCVKECFENIANLNENVEIENFVIMPNHVHGIIVIKNIEKIPLKEQIYGFEISERRGRRSLQGLVRDFKSVTTRKYKKLFNAESSLWQDSFYDKVIRNQNQFDIVWNYIEDNPKKWFFKKNNKL